MKQALYVLRNDPYHCHNIFWWSTFLFIELYFLLKDKRIARQYGYSTRGLWEIAQGFPKKVPLEIALLLLNVCYYASGNLNELSTWMAEVFSLL